MRKRFLSAAAAVALLTSGFTGSAAAAPPQKPSPLETCVQEATTRQVDSWSCLGGLLTYEGQEVENGKAVTRVRSERVAPETGPSGDVSTQSHSSDFDTWCETGTVCTRRISAYISETKGNAAYGNSSGSIGNFDVVIRTNLNGRQQQWRVYWFHDRGPALNFERVYINCYKDTFIDTNCGNFAVDGNSGDGYFRLSSTSDITAPPFVYGNRLNDSDDYYATVGGYFVPDGYPRFTMGTLRTANANCYGTGNCTFP